MKKITKVKKTLVKNSKPNPNAAKKIAQEKRFVIPASFFSQLQEFSNGGYCLLLINDLGNPEIYTKFDTSVASLALHKFGLDYFDLMDGVNTNVTQQSIYPKDTKSAGGEELPV